MWSIWLVRWLLLLYKGFVVFSHVYCYGRTICDKCYCHMFVWRSPPCSWGSLLGEVFSSLKTVILLLSQWNHCPNCSIPVVALLSGPSYSSLGGIFSFPGWSMILNCVILFGVNYSSVINKVVMSVTYCDPDSGSLMSCGVWKICSMTGVVCHIRTWSCVLSVLNGVFLICFYGSCACPTVVIGSGLSVSHDSWSYDICCI